MTLTAFAPETDDLLIDVADSVATFTLNRPDRLNAFSPGMLAGLAEGLRRAEKDSDVRAIVLTGSGRGFCAGGDVQNQKARATGNAARETFEEHFERLHHSQRATSVALHRIPKPTIAAINGPAAGAGLSIALACDLRVAKRSAKLTTAFAKVGFSGDYGGSWFLTQLVGPAKARELYFLSAKLTAEEAAALGIVNRVLDDDDFDAGVADFVSQLASGPGLAFRYMKANLNRALTDDLEECLDQEALGMVRAGRSDDHREGATAFTEKRPPVFTGK
jgi:2-(1,2-epoxy-1,2-dihydrophenyl)acetyl-CoA isomerase